MLSLAGAALVGGLAATVLERLHVPAAWLAGPLITGMLWTLASGTTLIVPTSWHRLAMALIGVSIAQETKRELLLSLGEFLAPAVLPVLAVIGMGLGLGLLFSRVGNVDPTTGMLSFLPGGASAVVALSRDLQADPRLVATLQYLRLLIVVLVAPFIVALMMGTAAPTGDIVDSGHGTPPVIVGLDTTIASTSSGKLLPFVLTFGSAVLGVIAAKAFRFPTTAILLPLGLITAAIVAGLPIARLPPVLTNGAFLLLGLWAGLQFDRRSLRQVGGTAARALPLIMLMIGFSVLMAASHHRHVQGSLVTSLLAMMPGGLEAMLAASLDLGADPAVVLAIQLTRLFLVLALAPFIRGRRQRLAGSEAGAVGGDPKSTGR